MADTGDLEQLQQQLGYQFDDLALLRRALSHRSYSATNNERLEFLGDAILGLYISKTLFRDFPDAAEGELSRTRANLVNRPALAALARELHLGDYLTLGVGEVNSGGAERDSTLADAFEALIAAIYLDKGLDASEQVLQQCYASRLSGDASVIASKDAKTQLQELLQGARHPLPQYKVLRTSGEKHQQQFVVECRLPHSGLCTDGEGRSRRAAEQAAAQAALNLLEESV